MKEAEMISTYGFTDVAGEHWMVLGTGGVSFATDPEEAYLVAGRDNADSFVAWIRNEQGCHLRAVRLSGPEAGPWCRCGSALPRVNMHETPFEFCSESCKQAEAGA